MANKPLVFKTSQKAWVYDGDTDTLTQVTDVDYPALTVPGIVYLDGTYYVMTPAAEIYGSDIEAPLSWTALNFITAETETDAGVAIAKYLNYLVAFGTWSTEFFYDAQGAAPGSPLLPSENMFLPIGCASAKSVAASEISLIWMAQAKEGTSAASAGRSIVMLRGTQHQTISTPAVERVLNADSLSGVYSKVFKLGGHEMYMLTLTNSAKTLVFDLISGLWYQWTSMTVQAPKTATSLTYNSTTQQAEIALAGHGYADGDVVIIAGATPTAYNVTTNITYIDADHFSYDVTGTPTSPATGTITTTGYTESYFKMIYHLSVGSANMFADASSGYLYTMSEGYYDDNGAYINCLIRTPNMDLGSHEYKRISRVDLVGDKVAGTALVRYSKDDYVTHSAYRKVNLNLVQSRKSRMGRAVRISFDVRITDAIPVRLERMDVTFEGE